MLKRRIIIIAGLLLPVLISGMVLAVVLDDSKPMVSSDMAGVKGPVSGPAYKEGEIIVKFKGQAADILDGQTFEAEELDWLELSPSLDKIGSKYGVGKIRPLIKNFKAKRQRMEDLKTKEKASLTKREKHLLRRLKRAPKGAKVPDLGRIYKVELEAGQSAPRAAAEYNRDPDVEYAELNYIVSICATEPNDPCYPLQWPLSNIGQLYPIYSGGTASGTPNCDIDANEAWDINTGSSDVIVAVIDTGVDYDHNDIKANMWTDANGCYGYDWVNKDNDPMDDNGHGTHCSGIIAADSNNGLDIAGVCWDANIMALKSLDSEGYGYPSDAVAAIYYAVANGADITSNSWGGPYSKAEEEAFDYAYSQGIVNIAAAGNYSSSVPRYPAAYDSVVAVAATNSDDERAYFSSYGDWIDVAAPGRYILSLRATGTGSSNKFHPWGDPSATMYIESGTSMACPHVAGLAALLLAEEPNLAMTPGDVRLLIRLGADDVNNPDLGYGRINAYESLNNINNLPEPNKATILYPANDANLISINVDLSWSAAADELASSHDVYFGTDYNDVNDANTSSPEYKDTIDVFVNELTYDPDTLDANTTHYWRIDARNWGNCTKGDIWSFTTRDGNVFYVDTDANGSNNGTSWTDAFNSLDDAIDEPWGGDEIWVAEGTYKPDSNDRTDSFVMREGINLYGGFAGTESSKSGRDPNLLLNITTLTGDINEPNDANDNCYHVVTGANDMVLDRFTITDGNANGSGSNEYGGGMYNYELACITINDCLFATNKASSYGGGIYNKNVDEITVSGCTFTSNEAGSAGGGMYKENVSQSTVTGCTFTSNEAGSAGGGMYKESVSQSTVTGCTFTSNEAGSEGGGMYWAEGVSETTVTGCTFTNNECGDTGGGMYFDNVEKVTMSDCIISKNSSDNEAGGAFIYVYEEDPQDYAVITVTNCIFWGNMASTYAGGLLNENSSPTLTNCTFTDNTAGTYGGGMCNDDYSDPLVTNCIFWANKAGTDCNEVYNIGSSDPTFSYCDIQDSNGSGANWDTNLGNDDGGNIDADPCFADADSNDYHLIFSYDSGQYSPCMDAGDPDSPSDANDYDPYDANSTDIDGQLRAMDGDGDGNSVVDMGADEVPGPCLTCVGDLDGDNVVELSDLNQLIGDLTWTYLFTGEWLILPDDPATAYLWKTCSDMDQDYDIDLDDLDLLADNLTLAYINYGHWWYECGDPLSFHFYVSPDGSDDANGLTWATAFATIQHGLDVAGNSAIVEVNEGKYYETIDFNGVSCTVTSTDPNDDNVVGATIIDANGTGYAVEFSSGEDANSILTGFTVTGGSNYGVYCSGSSPVITRCIIKGNTDGIGIYISDSGSAPAIKNNLIYDNEKGISFGNANSGSIVCNNTIVGNTTSGIYKTQGNNPSISNCVVWDCNDDLYNCSATYSCIEDGDGGTGNISGYPLFVDVNNDNYRLDRNSPCVDAGNGNTAPATDMDGQARIDIPEITNTGTGTPAYTDIGAYETDTNSPTNTTCETARNLGVEEGGSYTTGSTVDAADGVLWFTFTLEEAMCIEIELCDSDFDTTLTLYDGSCGSLQEIEFNNNYAYCGDGTQSKIKLELDGEETPYFLKVAGNNGARGNYALEVYEGECEGK